MSNKICSKFIKYSNLNEISKFSNLNNIFLSSNLKTICVSLNLDLSLEKSKLFYYYKGLIGMCLIYLITNKYPTIKISKDQSMVCIQSDLFSSNLFFFLEKFLIIWTSNQKKKLIQNLKIKDKNIRFLITDFTLFTELENFLYLFNLVEFIYIDFIFNHKNNINNFLFLDNLFKSSSLI